MACYHPLKGYRGALLPSGKCGIVFKAEASPTRVPMQVPCGQCVGCRLERSRQWAVRCIHEASLHSSNVFITLTYNDANLPRHGSLHYPDFQKFMKRLRKKFGSDVRFYMAGEYGENFGRPHYHAILFNLDFPDKYKWRKTKTGHLQYRSATLEQLWPYGNCEIGTVTYESAAYVARYIMKKVTGDAAEFHYSGIDPDTGEVLEVVPEFNNMSRRPGIGKGWFDKFHASDVAPHDHVVINGRAQRPPRYYDCQFELKSPEDFAKLKRVRRAKIDVDNNTVERLRVREHCAKAKLKHLVRPLD